MGMLDTSLLPDQQPLTETPKGAGNLDLSFLPNQPNPAKDEAKNTLKLVADVNPDQEAEARSLADKHGLDLPLVRDNLDSVRKMEEERKLDPLLEKSRALAEFMADPSQAAVSKDDAQTLADSESIWKSLKESRWGKGLSSNYRQMDEMIANTPALYGYSTKMAMGQATPEDLAQVDKLLEGMTQPTEPEGILETVAFSTANQLPIMFELYKRALAEGQSAGMGAALAALIAGQAGPQAALPEEVLTVPGAYAAGVAVGSRKAAIETSYRVETAATLSDLAQMRDANGERLNPQLMGVVANLAGMAKAGLEAWGFETLLHTVPGGRRLFNGMFNAALKKTIEKQAVAHALTAVGKDLGVAFASNALEEGAQEAIDVFADEFAKQFNDASKGTYFEGIDMKAAAARILDSFIKGGAGAVGLGAPGTVARGAHVLVQTHESNQFRDRVVQTGENLDASKTKARSPETLKQFIQVAGMDEEAYIDAENVLLQMGPEKSSELAVKLGVLPETFMEAAKSGQGVKVRTSDIYSSLAKDEITALAEDLKPAPGAFTPREAKDFKFDETMGRLGELAAEDGELTAARQEMRNQIRGAFAARGLASQELDAAAEDVAAYWERAAVALDIRGGRDAAELLRSQDVKGHADHMANLILAQYQKVAQQRTQTFKQDHPAMAGVDMNDAAQVAEAQKLWAEMGTESPYFKKWSGGAPVVTDASAKGNIVDTERLWRDKQYMKTLEGYAAAERARLEKDIAAEQAWWEANVKDPANPTAEEMNSALDMGIIPPINNNWDAVREQASTSLAGYEKQIAEMAPTIKDREGKTEIFQTGKPVVARVFHATPFGELSGGAFDPQFLGKNTKAGSATLAYFFAGTEDTAGAYAKGDIINQRGFLSMSPADKTALIDGLGDHLRDQGVFGEDEYVHEDDVARWAEENPRDVKEYAESYILPDNEEYDPRPVEPKTYELYVNLKNPLVYDFKGERYRETSYFDILKKAKDAGHDGAVFLNTYDGGPKDNIFAVFPGHEIQIKSVFNRGTFDGSDPRILMQSAASAGATPDARAEYFKNSKVRDKDGNLKVLFHGAKRADRINEAEKFSKDRATSGPMAFFTDDPEIASGYASGKQDTSLEVESLEPFFVVNGKKDFKTAWYSIDPLKRVKIKEMAHRIGLNEDSGAIEIVMRDGDKNAGLAGRQHFEYELKQAGGNAIKALYEMWVNSGSIFGEERRFVDVLRAAGIEDVVFNDPYAEFPGVFPVYMNITNPLDTSAIPKKVVAALKKAAKQNPNPEYTWGVDGWDKRGPRGSGENWFPYFEQGLKDGNTLAWTVVPDWVTETLKALGYDGIKDTGGKQGGAAHEVWIPFEENQVKSVFNQNPTRDPRILMQSAFHGSPYRFDKFSLEHIGSGEGAQAYGYGLYFAGKKEVAEWYRRKLADGVIPVVDSVKALAGKDISQEAYDFLRGYEDVDGAIKGLQDTAKSTDPMLEKAWAGREAEYADLKKKYLTAADWLETNKDRIELKKDEGQLYEVNIPDDEHLMLWDRPLSEQPEAVKKALEEKVWPGFREEYINESTARRSWELKTGERFYQDLTAKLGSDRAASEYLRSIGIPGHKYLDGTSRSAGEGSYNYVIYDDQAVQIAKTYYQGQQAAAFYSQLERVLSAKLSNGTAAQHLKTLDAWVKKGEFKGEELEWSGLREWLAGRGDQKTSKEEVLDFLRQGGVKVEEVVKGGAGEHVTQAMIDAAEDAGNWDEYDRLTRIYEDQELGSNANGTGNETKFGQYQLPGGENYRELLLTLPHRDQPEALDPLIRFLSNWPDDPTTAKNPADQARLDELNAEWDRRAAQPNFRSSHFSEPNILAHVRFNERTDAEGKRVLFIEEIQSDWAQKGRKEGFASDKPAYTSLPEGYSVKSKEEPEREGGSTSFTRYWVEDAEGNRVSAYEYSRESAVNGVINALNDEARGTTASPVPDAPFVKNTSAWSMLAMKRMIRWAAENGFDKVAWTTGEQQAERYDLSKRIGKILWNEDTKRLTAWDTDKQRTVIDESGVDAPELEDYVGKEAAQKLIDQEADDDGDRQLSGLDLKVGGEGMRGFYDKILPNETNKLIKKWGAKVGETSIISGSTGDELFEIVLPNGKVVGRYESEKRARALAETFDGAIVRNSGQGVAVHSFDITPAMREGAMAGQALFQAAKGPRGAMTPVGMKYFIRLFQDADLSTLLHESAHVFFSEIQRAIENNTATDGLKQDWDAIQRWTAKNMDKRSETWTRILQAANGNVADAENTYRHELFARAFETYLQEGKAPTAELEGAFSRFRRWLVQIYKDAHGIQISAGMNFKMDPEIRRVFDNLLGAQNEVEQASAVYEMTAMTERQMDMFGVAKADREYMRRLVEQAKIKGESRLIKDRAKGKMALRRQWKEEITKALEEDRDQIAARELKKGYGLNYDKVAEYYGEEAAKGLQRNMLTRNDMGRDPVEAAYELGYDNPEQFINALWNLRPIDELVRERMAQREAEYDSQFKVEDYVVGTDEYADYLAMRNRYIAQGVVGAPAGKNAKVVARQLFRAAAKQRIYSMPVSEAMRTDLFLAAMRKANEAERKAVDKGDWAEASKANERARLNYEYASEAAKIREQVEGLKKAAKRLAAQGKAIKKGKPSKIEERYYKAALKVLARYGVTPPTVELDGAPALATLLNPPDDALLELGAEFSDWLVNETDSRPLKALSAAEVSELSDLIKYLEGTGRMLVADTLHTARVKMSMLRDQVVANLETLKDRKVLPEKHWLRKWADKKNAFMAENKILLSLMRELDGYQSLNGKPGPMETIFYDALEKANRESLNIKTKWAEDTRGALAQLLKSAAKFGKFENLAPHIAMPEWLRADGRTWDFETVISVALNMGNAVNRSRLMDGYNLSEAALNEITAKLTDEDWEAVQTIGKAISAIWPKLSAVYKRMNHFEPTPVEATPFTTKSGKKLDGWYYPLRYDPANVKAGQREERNTVLDERQASFMPSSVAKGSMMARKASAGGMPPLLKLSVLDKHVQWAAHYASHAEIIADLNRLLTNPKSQELRDAIKRKLGDDTYKALVGLMRNIARPGFQDKPTTLETITAATMNMAAVFAMNLNRMGAIQQLTAIGNYITEEGAAQGKGAMAGLAVWAKGALRFLANPKQAIETMRELSPIMDDRLKETVLRQTKAELSKTDLNDIRVGRGPKERTLRLVKGLSTKAATVMYQFFDSIISVPGWWGSYLARIEKGMDPQEAADQATKVFAAYSPLPREMDRTITQNRKGLNVMYTFLSGWAAKYYSKSSNYYRALKAGKITATQFMSHVLWERLMPVMVARALAAAVYGGSDDKDDDRPWWMTLLDWGMDVGTYSFTGIPLARDIANIAANGVRSGLMDQNKMIRNPFQLPSGMVIDLFTKSTKALMKLIEDADDEATRYKALLAVSELLAFGFKMPNAAKVVDDVLEGIRQAQEEDDSTAEGIAHILLRPDPKKKEKK